MQVPTYDQQPEMSVQQVADKVAEVVKTNEYEFVMCNFAPPDMVRVLGFDDQRRMLTRPFQVGHTGVYDAAVKAITAADAAVGTIAAAAQEAGYVLLITADHGNAEQMLNPDTGAPHTAHTTNPVPFIIKTPGSGAQLKLIRDVETKAEDEEEEKGALCDVAPTILDIMVSALAVSKVEVLMGSCVFRASLNRKR